MGVDYQGRSETRIPSAVAGVSVMGTLKTVIGSGVQRRRKALCLFDDTEQAYRMYSPKSDRETGCLLCVKQSVSVRRYSTDGKDILKIWRLSREPFVVCVLTYMKIYVHFCCFLFYGSI